jgi:hypothetical protein
MKPQNIVRRSQFHKQTLCRKLYYNNYLSRNEIFWSMLQEDMLFGLLTHSTGMRFGGFTVGSIPLQL